MEVYDYIIWLLFSVYLTKEFLPPKSNVSDVFFLFFITYMLRPIGGFISGILADQLGRKKILTYSILLMGVSTGFIGLLPSYKIIGVSSFIILMFLRSLQALSINSEYISSISLLIESCEKNRKGYYGSWAAMGVNFGALIASLMSAIVLYCISNNYIPMWSWRVVFVVSFATMGFGYWIRRSIPESFEFVINNARSDKRSINQIFSEAITYIKYNFIECISVFALVFFGVSTTSLIYLYTPVQMSTINNIANYQSFLINSIGITVLILFIPIFGLLSDKYGRIKLLSIAISCLLLLVVPYFKIIFLNEFYSILFFHIIISIPCACIVSLTPVLITEIFPLSIRCTITGTIYSIGSCLGGGLSPLLAFKISMTKSIFSSYYISFILLFLGIISLASLFILNIKKTNQYALLKAV